MNTAFRCVLNTLSSSMYRMILLAVAICAPLHVALAQDVTVTATGGDGQTGSPGQVLSIPLSASFSSSSYGSGDTATWTISQGDATFVVGGQNYGSQYSNTTSLPGSSSVLVKLGTSTGLVVVDVTCGLCNGSAEFYEYSSDEQLSIYAAGGDGQTGAPNTTLPLPLAVQVYSNFYNEANDNATITWQVIKGSASIVEGNGTSYTDSVPLSPYGDPPYPESSVHIALGATPGPVVVRALCGECKQFNGTTVQIFNLMISPSTLQIVSGNNQIVAPGTQAKEPLVVNVSAEGKPTPGQTVSWSVTSGQATLSSATSVTDSSGNASVNFTAGDSTQPIVIQASIPGSQVTLTASPVIASIAAVSGDNQSGPQGSAGDAPLVVRVTDSTGKPLSGQTVYWGVSAGQAVLAASSSTTDADGRASMGFQFAATPGSSTVIASVGSAQVGFTISTFAPALQSVSGANQSGVVGTTLQPFVVQIGSAATDGGHVQSGPRGLGQIAVSWSVLQGGGTLAAMQTFTDASGRTSNTLTLGTSPGVNVVQATVAGAGTLTFTATATAAVGGSSVFSLVSGNNQALVPGQPSQPLVVKVAGSDGTPINGVGITWTASSANANLASASNSTGADGTAQNTLTVVLPGDYTVTAQITGLSTPAPLTFTFNNGVANLPGLNGPQTIVARIIDKACPALATSTTPLTPAQQDFLQRCSELVVNAAKGTLDKVPGALNAMLNNKALPQRGLAQGVQAGQFTNLNTRLAELRQGAGGLSLAGLSLSEDGRTLPLAMLGDIYRKDPQHDDEVGKDFARWGFFATGMINRGSFNATTMRPGFDFHSASLTAGVDYRVNADFVGGLALGYNSNRSSLDQDAGNADVDSYSLSGYFSWYHGDFYVEGSLVSDWLDYDLSRNITYQITNTAGDARTLIDQTASASPSGRQNSVSLSAGKDFNRKAWNFSPYLRGVWSHLSLDGFSETMSDPGAPGAGLGTSVAGRSLSSMLGVLGGRISYTTSTDWGVLIPNAVVEWNHEFRNDPQTAVVRFLADPTQTPIRLTDQAPDASFFNIGIGLNAVFAQGRSGYVYYEHMVGNSGISQNRLSVGIRIEF